MKYLFYHHKLLFLLSMLHFLILGNSCQALCLGYPWITEFHAKRMGVNCRSAQKQIDELVKTIHQALLSGRRVDLDGFGSFDYKKSTAKTSNSKYITFKPSRELSESLNKAKK